MSRIGKKPIEIPHGVKAGLDGKTIKIEGPKGRLEERVHLRMDIKITDNQIIVSRPSDNKLDKALHGLTRSLIQNMVIGVTEGYKKELEIQGVGLKAQLQGKKLNLQLGFSHPVNYDIPQGISIVTPKPTQIEITGIDKQLVGEVAAEIRQYYKPEPYKGKGIRYKGEYVRRKSGKTVV